MNILLFDTETTGIVNFKKPVSDPCQPRLVQIAALLVHSKEGECAAINLIIKPDGFEVPKAASDVHGITTDHAAKVGIPVKTALEVFLALTAQAALVVGHNVPFDIAVVGAELHRLKVSNPLEIMASYCTMRESTDIVKIPSAWGYKWPKLVEAYRFAFKESLEGAHDAMVDLRATYRLYSWLKGREAKVASTLAAEFA